MEPNREHAGISFTTIFFIVVAGVGALLFLVAQTDFGPPAVQALPCSDGTPDSACSTVQPFYCSNGSLAEAPATCGCPGGFRFEQGVCVQNYACSDGTLAPDCSPRQPKQCIEGKLVDNAPFCGCPDDYAQVNESCQRIKRCTDGTPWGECAAQKPEYCENGSIVSRASVCGCPEDFVIRETNNNTCVSRFLTSVHTVSFTAVIRGSARSFDFKVYQGLAGYLAGLDRDFVCDPVCPTDSEMTGMVIDNFLGEPQQSEAIDDLVEHIIEQERERDEQARFAISLVQHIPYDYSRLLEVDADERYPYQVLFDNAGVCGEKSKLLALLLDKLGFGVAILDYPDDMHQTVGIFCPANYSLDNTGYCFVESTTPSIITDDDGNYTGVGQLGVYEVFPVATGFSLESVSEEYDDAIAWRALNEPGGVSDAYTYGQWLDLVDKYDIETG
ncbi:MAG: hypothetical protein WC607_00065 [Candidatus Micrarchaeia archaeon]